jgi:L-rhamnose mutarotase
VFSPYSHIRLTWKKKEWNNTTIFQLRTIDLHGATEIRIHHEELQSLAQKEEMKKYWYQILDRLKRSIPAK